MPAHTPSASAPKSRPAKAAARRTAEILRSDIASLEVRFQAGKSSSELCAGIAKPTNETNGVVRFHAAWLGLTTKSTSTTPLMQERSIKIERALSGAMAGLADLPIG